MIKRVIEISKARTHLSVKHKQLVIKQDGLEVSQIPCEDIGVLLVDNQAVTYTHSVFTELLNNGVAVLLCNGSHHPSGMFLPIESNSIQSERFRNQVNAKEPLKKQLWKQVVQAKIAHQAKLVKDSSNTYQYLKVLQKKVRSGDPENIEAQASKKFWRAYLQNEKFKRNREGIAPNNMLNYGYMVLRAAVARAICSAGLLPTLGIHHRNRYNAFCLADDMVEPFRGYIEEKVRDIYYENSNIDLVEKLDQPIKAQILEVLYQQIQIAGNNGPLMVGLHRTMTSLQRCFEGGRKKLDLPKYD